MNYPQQEMDVRYALALSLAIMCVVSYSVSALCPGAVSYWLWADCIVIPCAIWSLARLRFAGRQGRFARAAMLCLLFCLGAMVYKGDRVGCIQPPPTVSTALWVLIDAVSLPPSAASAALADRTGNDGRLRRGGTVGQ